MRISDWSSDVCSSDLSSACSGVIRRGLAAGFQRATVSFAADLRAVPAARDGFDTGLAALAVRFVAGFFFADFLAVDFFAVRSEEHTSELQSLMRISYAVFCLKKKKKHHTNQRIAQIN